MRRRAKMPIALRASLMIKKLSVTVFGRETVLAKPRFTLMPRLCRRDFGKQKIKPEAAFYSNEMGEYLLKYEDVRQAENPDQDDFGFSANDL